MDNLEALTERCEAEGRLLAKVRREIARVVVGQEELVESLLLALLCDKHVLIEGIPGLAKTLTVTTLAQALDVSFSRLQFTPDLLPGDLIGTLIYNQTEGDFRVHKGPVFANIILADEINRSPAKVQSALLEAMQERHVTIGRQCFQLEDPFLVMATQNPIEQEGTYPLPEAQVDRFMFKVNVDYPSRDEEREIQKRMARSIPELTVDPVVSAEDILRLRKLVDDIHMEETIADYILDLVAATRDPGSFGLDMKDLIRYGASPRATIYLTMAARGRALVRGRGYVMPDDVKAVAVNTLRHRIIITYHAEARGISSEDLLAEIMDAVEVP